MTVLAQLKELLDDVKTYEPAGGGPSATVVSDLDSRVYRDEPPEMADGGPAFPYVTIFEDVERNVELPGDGGTIARRVMAQIDLWQLASAEDDQLAPAIVDRVDGVKLAAPALRARVRGTSRFPEDRAGTDDRIVHHAITVSVPLLG